MGKTKQDYENEIVAKGITLGTTAAKLEASLISKTDNKAALDLRGVNPSDILREYPDRIAAIKAWQELAQFGIPQSEIDEKNSKWADGVAYANELLRDYPDGEIPDGVLDMERLLIYPFSNSSSLITYNMFSGSNLEYFKDNVFTYNNTDNYLPQAFKNCGIGNATINITNTNIPDYSLLYTFSGISFKKATINIPNSKLPQNGGYGYNNIFGFSRGDELTINVKDFDDTLNFSFFTGIKCNKLTLNISDSSGYINNGAYLFLASSINELNINTNIPVKFKGNFDSILANSDKLETINFDIIGELCNFRNFFSRASIKTLKIFDCRDVLHRNTYDGYNLFGCFGSPIESAQIKTSEGINLTSCNLDNTSITYLINNLSYPTHSDYEKNGGTLRPTIKLHPDSYTYFISQQNLVDRATTLGYDIIQ